MSTHRQCVAAPGGGRGRTRALGLSRDRDGLLFASSRVVPDVAAPLLVLLHGAGANAADVLPLAVALAEDAGALVLAPDAREATWDLLLGGYGPDARFIDHALEHVLGMHTVDAARLAIGGFSDGASYALSLGLDQGDRYAHVLAFAPGFAAPEAPVGRPRVYVAHGTADRVLPIDRCSRRIVPLLREADYDVHYREFVGGHVVPADVAEEAFAWWLGHADAR